MIKFTEFSPEVYVFLRDLESYNQGLFSPIPSFFQVLRSKLPALIPQSAESKIFWLAFNCTSGGYKLKLTPKQVSCLLNAISRTRKETLDTFFTRTTFALVC